MKNFVESSKLIEVLDGIEKAPRMYGSLDAVEGQYYLLLSFLVDDVEKLKDAFSKSANKAAKHETNEALNIHVKTHEELIFFLKKIREEIMDE